MKKMLLAVALIGALDPLAGSGQDATGTLEAAAVALGASNLTSIEFSGTGSDYIFGQAYDGSSPWPRFGLLSYSVSIDYARPALRDERRRTQVQNPPLGGGFQPLVGEQRQIWLLSGAAAWDIVNQNPVPPAVERDMRPATEGRLAQIWLTPHGFVKAARANQPTVRTASMRGATKNVVAFTAPTNATFEATFSEEHLVERIETWLDNPMLGDTVFEAIFSDYRDFDGVRFPTRIVHRSGGYPVLDVTITSVTPNRAMTIEVPEAIRQPSTPAPPPQPEEVADGVWIIPGAAKSVAIEFEDDIVVVEAPENEARSIAVMEAIATVIPGKPVRYVVNTHSHFDHAGGLRTYAAEGAAIITHAGNIPYYEQIWRNPRTIRPDRLAASGRTPVFEGVVGSRTLTDGSRRMVIYHYAGNMHNAGMLMVFLPKERILIQADSYTPPAAPDVPPAGIPNLVHFYEAVERLRLDVDQIIPIHGRLVTLEEVAQASERYKDAQLWAR